MDILTVSDFRLPGGTSHSNAEEITAQFGYGLHTELVQVNGSLSATASGLNPRIEGLIRNGRARCVPAPHPRRAPLAIVRHPAMLAAAAAQVGPIDVDHVVIVVNATPIDWTGQEHWRPEEVHPVATDLFGVEPLWAPIGPTARRAIADRVPAHRLRTDDWVNIIDVDHWWVDRQGRDRSRRPVVGRHSRASAQKWPSQPDRETIYPADSPWDFRVLGWGSNVRRALGPPPPSWTVLPFGSVRPRDFLADLDFFVYYHHPKLQEAFGRTILEAIASGLPAILPPHFEELFGAAAVYADPDSVGDVIDHLWSDEQAYRTQVHLARALVEHRFSYAAHARRLTEFLPDFAEPTPTPSARTSATTAGTNRTTTAAPAETSRDSIVVIDLTAPNTTQQPASAPAATTLNSPDEVVARLRITSGRKVEALGPVWTDVVPSAAATRLSAVQWKTMLTRRVRALLDAHPNAAVQIVVDPSTPADLVDQLRHPPGGPAAQISRVDDAATSAPEAVLESSTTPTAPGAQ